jgi:hypothetical protein
MAMARVSWLAGTEGLKNSDDLRILMTEVVVERASDDAATLVDAQ